MVLTKNAGVTRVSAEFPGGGAEPTRTDSFASWHLGAGWRPDFASSEFTTIQYSRH